MKLWSIQHRDALDVLRKKGVLKADGRRCDPWFRESYKWMRQMLVKHRPGTKNRPLLWAWANPKPDLRGTGHLRKGTPGVRFELEIPDERVLCSDFEAWHFVLNQEYLPTDPDDYRAFEAEWEAWHTWMTQVGLYKGHPAVRNSFQREHKERIESSWERVFDLEMMNAMFNSGDSDFGTAGEAQWVQAVFTHFTLDEVVRVTEFTAR